jgi:hypothetical protein
VVALAAVVVHPAPADAVAAVVALAAVVIDSARAAAVVALAAAIAGAHWILAPDPDAWL